MYIIQVKTKTSSHKRYWVGRGVTTTQKSNATNYAQEGHARIAMSLMGSYSNITSPNVQLKIIPIPG